MEQIILWVSKPVRIMSGSAKEVPMSAQTQFYVQGMKCGGCVESCKKAVAEVDGVESAEFDLATGTGVVQGNVDPQAVCQALTAAGYPAVVKSD
jgi:copper chaperone CopZ